jgi:hypothetical protein
MEAPKRIEAVEEIARNARGLHLEALDARRRDIEQTTSCQLPGDAEWELGLSRAGVAREQQRPVQKERNIDRIDKPTVRLVVRGMILGADFGIWECVAGDITGLAPIVACN